MDKSKMNKITIRGTERLLFENSQGFYKAILDKEDVKWINDISKGLTEDYELGIKVGRRELLSKILSLNIDNKTDTIKSKDCLDLVNSFTDSFNKKEIDCLIRKVKR